MTVDGRTNWVFHVACDIDRGERPEDFTHKRCVAVVHAAVGDPDLDVEVRSVLPWRPRSSLADRFAVARVFLVRDAAHTVSPLGAFDLNTGVADAHNLAWKLAAVQHGEAGAGLLDTYAQEREPVAAATLDQAMRRLADPQLHWGRGPEADAARAAAGVWAAPVVHLGQRYGSPAVDPRPELPSTADLAVALDGPPGSRVPHAWADGVSTLDLVASRWTLLVGAAGDRWLAASAHVGLPAHRVSTPWLSDDGALLVRPDAIVAMRVTAVAPDPARSSPTSWTRCWPGRSRCRAPLPGGSSTKAPPSQLELGRADLEVREVRVHFRQTDAVANKMIAWWTAATEPEVTLEAYGDPGGWPGQAELWRIILICAAAATELPGTPHTSGQPVISGVRPSGTLLWSPLIDGQPRGLLGLLVTLHP